MTLEEFEIRYYEATGMLYMTVEFITEGIPESYDDKIDYFKKFEGYIQLLQNHSYDGEIRKYGRFDINWNASELTNKLIEIIFGQNSGEEIDNDENTETTTKISTYNNLDDITEAEKNDSDFYLVKTNLNGLYNGYTYKSGAFQQTDKQYFILNTDQELEYTNQLPESLEIHDIHLPSSVTDYTNLTVIYQVNTNAYYEYVYNSNTGEFVKTLTAYNDADDTIEIGIDYILDEDKEYIITEDGRKILVY